MLLCGEPLPLSVGAEAAVDCQQNASKVLSCVCRRPGSLPRACYVGGCEQSSCKPLAVKAVLFRDKLSQVSEQPHCWDKRLAVMVAVSADILITFRLPEWPSAATALVRLVVALSGKAGIQSPDKDARLACMDLLGTITAQAFFEAEVASQQEGPLRDLLGERV